MKGQTFRWRGPGNALMLVLCLDKPFKKNGTMHVRSLVLCHEDDVHNQLAKPGSALDLYADMMEPI